MKVTEFASRNPIALHENDSLLAAARVFLANSIDGAPVLNDAGAIVGILTKTHLYRAIVHNVPFTARVGALMRTDVKTIRADRPVEEAWQMAWEHGIGRLPVVDGDNRLVAMMTRTNLVQAFELLYQDLDAIINSSCDGIAVVDEYGTIVKYNEAFHSLVAAAAGSGRAALFDELFERSALGRAVVQVSRDAVRDEKPVSVVQQFAAGKEILITASPVYAREIRKIPRVVVNCRDISSINDLRRQLEATRELTEVYHSELETLRTRALGHTFVCGCESMRKVFDLAIRVAKVDSTILILGESGVGKEIVAGLIHKMSRRAEAPLIRIN
ncbi:MAG: CBS domain-containing protein, partial [Firmicutes bacterium]|nr:CBS domain-containing protein [Bacillota bacterium]